MFVATVPLCLLARSAHVPRSWGADLSIAGLLGGGLFLLFPLVGAMIASRRPKNPIGWILLGDGLLWMLSDVMDYYAVYGVASPGSVPFAVGVAGINNVLWVPAVGLLGTYVFLLFPDGRLPSRRWRPLAWLCGVVLVLVSVGVGFGPGILEDLGGVRNPFGIERYPWVTDAAYVVLPLFLLCMLGSVLSLVMRYRRSRGEERQQIKWIAFAASFVGIVYVIAMVGSLVYPQETWFAAGSPLWLNFLEYAALLSFIAVPIAVGFAVLRYRLYDIDVLINRTLVYASLTAMLIGLYFGGIVVLQRFFVLLTGQRSTLAVVASTLLIAALFNPLRHRIQDFIDRRFYRRKYDAARTLEEFGATLRNATDLDGLTEELTGVIRETVQPAHVFLWLAPAREKEGHE